MRSRVSAEAYAHGAHAFTHWRPAASMFAVWRRFSHQGGAESAQSASACGAGDEVGANGGEIMEEF